MNFHSDKDKLPCGADLEEILEWGSLVACRIHRDALGVEKFKALLRGRGESAQRLREIQCWRESHLFTEREKAALSLSEAIASRPKELVSSSILTEAKRCFNSEEMQRLTLSAIAINEVCARPGGSSSRILIIEDNPADQALLRRQLERARMHEHVIFLPDGKQALELLERFGDGTSDVDFIAVFLDLKLPRLSGLELLKRIRTMEKLAELPVIVMTSSNDPSDIEECQRLKVASYVEKPVTFGAFAKAVANFFHQTSSVTFVRQANPT